jgi:hypothetical protein
MVSILGKGGDHVRQRQKDLNIQQIYSTIANWAPNAAALCIHKLISAHQGSLSNKTDNGSKDIVGNILFRPCVIILAFSHSATPFPQNPANSWIERFMLLTWRSPRRLNPQLSGLPLHFRLPMANNNPRRTAISCSIHHSRTRAT